MAKYFSRADILLRLRNEIQNGRAVIMFGAGIGLTAKCAEKGGADLIGVYSTAIYRMRGQSSLMAWLPYSNANEHLLRMSNEILPAVKNTPCIAGIGAHDPELDLDLILDQVIQKGYSGVNNEPFVGLYGPYFANQLEKAGIGFSREVEMIKRAHQKNIFTVAWAMSPDEAEQMAECGADVVGAMIGVTSGGISGSNEKFSLEEAAENIQKMTLAAKRVNPDVIVLTHGGPFNDVQTAQYSLQHSDADGYACGSSGERIPTEKAVIEITQQYKAITIK